MSASYSPKPLFPKPLPASADNPKPRRWVPASRVVSRCHAYLLETTGDNPPLKVLAALCDLPLSTVHRHCQNLGLPLSQSRPRKPKTGPT